MAAAAQTQTAIEWPDPLSWLRDFLREELAPYPGRQMLVARMVIAATVVMIVTMTFRLPYGAFGVLYVLIISREDTRATLVAAKSNIVGFAFAAAYAVIGAMVFSSDPNLRLVWVVVTLFAMFFVLSAATNYTAAVQFGFLLAITIPLWDAHISLENKVENTLWAAWTMGLGCVITAGVELMFSELQPVDDLRRSIAERLESVEEVLRSCAGNGMVEEKAADRATRLALLGASRLRRLLKRSGPSQSYAEKMGATVALVGRLVDLAAALRPLDVHVSEGERAAVRALADNVARIREDIVGGGNPRLDQKSEGNATPDSIPLLREMERTVSMIPETFGGSALLEAFPPEPLHPETPTRLFVPDTLTNPDHVKFALRGCLAASLCYVTYNLLGWPGISTAVPTCLVTALTTVGASRQKQILRFAGALAGGALGIASQVWILPGIESIFGFTIFFLAVTVLGAWITTSSPRLSYFGVQLLVAFSLINLSEFKIQTDLTLARDRVAGVFLGLFRMWLAFDQLWSAPAAAQMKRTFISVFHSLARLVRGVPSTNLPVAMEWSYALRETINRSLNEVRALGDGVALEFGPSRERDLSLRRQITSLQPRLRLIFITQVALQKYRARVPGFQLPAEANSALEEFDERLARVLETMADRLEGKARPESEALDAAFVRLKEAVGTFNCIGLQGPETSSAPAFLLLTRRLIDLTLELNHEI
jgi:multidrug resistance protein MdtO